MNNLVNEELNKMKYLLGYQKGKVISEQALVSSTTAPAAAPQTVEDVIKQIQTTLNTKYGTKLTVDGKWGNLTQTAFETAIKSKSAAAPTTSAAPTGTPSTSGTTTTTTAAPAAAQPAAPAASTTAAPAASTTAAPAASTTAAPAASTTAAPTPDEVVSTEVAPQSNRDQRRARQDLRRGNRRAMQDLRTQQRAQ